MKRLSVVLLAILSMGIVPHLVAAQSIDSQTLIIGKVSGNPKKEYPQLETMVNYLAGKLGIPRAEVILAESSAEMKALLRDGKVDLVTETPLSAFAMEAATGAEILLREWKKGVPSYRSVLFARKDSPIQSLDDLRGRTLVFQDPSSTSGYFLPLALLRQAGLRVVELDSIKASPPSDKVGYIFAKGDVNSLVWVADGQADVGAISSLDWAAFGEEYGSVRRHVRIFKESEPFVRSMILVRPGMSADQKAKIKNVLLHMHESEDGAAALKAYFKVKKYDEFIGDAAKGLESARKTYDLIKDKVE